MAAPVGSCVFSGAESSDDESDAALASAATARSAQSLRAQTVRPGKAAVSPSLKHKGAPPALGMLANEHTVTLLPVCDRPADSVAMDMILEQNKFLIEAVSKLSDAVVRLEHQIAHQAKELAIVHGRPQLFSEMPPVYNPHKDERPRPGPKDLNPFRELDPYEMGMLKRQMWHVQQNSPLKRQNFRRIVYPDAWHGTDALRVYFTALSANVQWKLWHYAFDDKATMHTVLTPAEIEASDKKSSAPPPSTAVRAPISANYHSRPLAMVPAGKEPRVESAVFGKASGSAAILRSASASNDNDDDDDDDDENDD